jgi:hypothetical protein
MAILSALLSLLSKKIGQLLQAVFGWAITGLFGRLPSKKQTALSVALVLSLMWPLLLVGVAFPGIASWAVAMVPLHDFAPKWILRLVWLGLALVAPVIVGAIVRWVSPHEARRAGGLRGLLAGYPLTIGFAASFLITLVVVPALKLAAMAKRWSDEHVYCQVKEGCYRKVLDQIRDAAEKGGVVTEERPVPKAMGLATRVLKWFARGGLDPIVADDPRMLHSKDVSLFLYPGDLLVRGEKKAVARVRAALLRELLHADAWLTEDPEAQHIEDELHRMWDVVGRHADHPIGGTARMRVAEIARELEKTPLPVDQWSLLFLNLHRLERAVAHGPNLIDEEPKQPRERVVEQHEVAKPEASAADLVRDAQAQTKQLVEIELALAKDELRHDLADAKRAAISFGVAAVAALLAATMMLVGLALAIFPGPVPALVIGAGLLVTAGALGFVGYRKVPTKPLERTRRRLETDVEAIKERRPPRLSLA